MSSPLSYRPHLAKRLRHRLRGLPIVLALSFRAAPRPAALFVLSNLAAQVAWLTSMYAVKQLIDAIVRGDVDAAIRAGILVAVTEGATYMLMRMHFLAREVEERAGLVVDQRLIALTAGIPGIEHHERPEYAKQVELLRGERARLAGMTNTVVTSLRSLLGFAGTAYLLASISPWLLLLGPIGAVTMLTGRWSNDIQKRAREATAERARLRQRLFDLGTAASTGKELRVFGLEEEIASRHDAASREVNHMHMRALWQARLIDLAGSLITSFGLVGAIAFVLQRAVSGLATTGDVVLTLRLASQLSFAISTLSWTGTYLMQALETAQRYLWLTDYAAEKTSTDEPAPVPVTLTHGITLEHVSFTYPGTDQLVLDDVSLSLPAGAVVALVGENGAGKTTVVKLLSRFYEPDSGRILIDDADLRRINPEKWRERIGASFQDYVRFELLTRETVGLGDLPSMASETHVLAALARAGATDVLSSLPAALDTQLGKTWDNGVELSGGQWQKLALARGLMCEAPLVTIFDEPTAALDADTEHALFERFSAAARSAERSGAVTLLISHRFSTVRMADLIVVFDKGRVVDHGTHADLLRRDGLYATLYRLQARAYV